MPLFRSQRPAPDAQGYTHAGAADLGQQQKRLVRAGDEPVIVVRLGDEFHAFAAACPHAAGDLSQGQLYRGRIDCPEHDYRFDVRSGRTLWPPDEVCRLKKYEVVVRDGQLFIRRPRGSGSQV